MQVPFRMPATRVSVSPARPCSIARTTGTPPATAASNRTWRPERPAASSSSGPACAMTCLLAVTTDFPAASARRIHSSAGDRPPISSTSTSTSSASASSMFSVQRTEGSIQSTRLRWTSRLQIDRQLQLRRPQVVQQPRDRAADRSEPGDGDAAGTPRGRAMFARAHADHRATARAEASRSVVSPQLEASSGSVLLHCSALHTMSTSRPGRAGSLHRSTRLAHQRRARRIVVFGPGRVKRPKLNSISYYYEDENIINLTSVRRQPHHSCMHGSTRFASNLTLEVALRGHSRRRRNGRHRPGARPVARGIARRRISDEPGPSLRTRGRPFAFLADHQGPLGVLKF